MRRVSVEVDQQIDAVVANTLRGLRDLLVRAVDEVVECGLDSPAQRRVFARADRVRMGFEAGSVVALPDLGQQERERMSAKIG